MKYFWIVVLLLYSIVWGRGIIFLRTNGISRKIAMWLMRFVMKPYSFIEDVLLNSFYNGMGLLGIILFSILLRIPLLKCFSIKLENIKYLFIAPMAVLSLANIIITIITPIFKSNKIVNTMMSVPWINFTSSVNPKIGPLIPCVGALLEELFFRGVVFYFAFYSCNFSFALSVLISTLMFGLQQGLFTTSISQFLLMFCGAIIVTIVSAAVMTLSNSIIPALFAHEIFVIFYFSKMGFEYKTGSVLKGASNANLRV